MPVARCCAAIPKQRDSLMLSYTPGCPFREMLLMLSCKLGFPFREMFSCCHTPQAAHSERHPYAIIQDGLQS